MSCCIVLSTLGQQFGSKCPVPSSVTHTLNASYITSPLLPPAHRPQLHSQCTEIWQQQVSSVRGKVMAMHSYRDVQEVELTQGQLPLRQEQPTLGTT